MKETNKRRGPAPSNKVKGPPARSETRDRKQQEKIGGGRNLKAKGSDVKPSSEKLNSKMPVGELKNGVEPLEIFEDVVLDCAIAVADTKPIKMDENYVGENLSMNSGDMDIGNDSDAETINGSASSQGDIQAADEEKEIGRTPKKVKSPSSDGSHAARSDRKTNKLEIKSSKSTPKKGTKPEKKLVFSSSSDDLKNMKIHPKPPSDSSEGAEDQPLEHDNGIHILEEASNGANSACSNDEALRTQEYHNSEDQTAMNQKIEEMENRIKDLESELKEVAALEIALYSVVPEHSCSAHKVHTPARRLSRLYIYACKYWSQDRRATVARNTVSGLVLVSKSCGNDVSRLTFWLSNTIVLREIISQTFGSSCQSSTIAKPFESNGGEKKYSSVKWKHSSGSRQLNKGLLQFVDNWQETRTFTAALKKIECWIFSRIVESVWWQTLTPNMQSHLGGSTTNNENLPDNDSQGNFSLNLWKSAFHDALKRLCPVRAGGHECGCLPVLARKVMEQCIDRLDVAMFNAILRESVHEIPTDPVSDPIVNSKVLPIPAGDLNFGSGAQLKTTVGNWARWLFEFFGMDTDSTAEDENNIHEGDDRRDTEESPKSFPLLNALSALLMLPKDMLLDRTIRMEVCPMISLPLVKRVLCNFSPDEFCPDPVPGSVLEAINAEYIEENKFSHGSSTSFPYTAAPIDYTPPSSSEIAERIAEARATSQFTRSPSVLQRKGYTSDEELDELESCLAGVVKKFPSSPTAVVCSKGNKVGNNDGDGGNTRYDLLREVWQAT